MRVPSITDRRVVLDSPTDEGRALASQAAACFEADALTMLGRLPSRDRDALSRLVSRRLAAHAAEQGIDLFPAAAKLSWEFSPVFPDRDDAACGASAGFGRSTELVAELATGVDGQFPEYLLEVVLDGVRGDEQAVRDLLVRVAGAAIEAIWDSRAVSGEFRGWRCRRGHARSLKFGLGSFGERGGAHRGEEASASSIWSRAPDGRWWRRSHSP